MAKCIDCKKEFNNFGDNWRTRCRDCYVIHKTFNPNPFNRRARPGVVDNTPLEWKEFLEKMPRLLLLCHPDKHSQSTASVETTQWLLKVRKKHGKQ